MAWKYIKSSATPRSAARWMQQFVCVTRWLCKTTIHVYKHKVVFLTRFCMLSQFNYFFLSSSLTHAIQAVENVHNNQSKLSLFWLCVCVCGYECSCLFWLFFIKFMMLLKMCVTCNHKITHKKKRETHKN